jgi:hypothetical protein
VILHMLVLKVWDYAVVAQKYYNILYAPPLEKLNLIISDPSGQKKSSKQPGANRTYGLEDPPGALLQAPPGRLTIIYSVTLTSATHTAELCYTLPVAWHAST